MKCKQLNPGADKFCVHYIKSSDTSAGLCTLPNNFRCIEALKDKRMKMSHSSMMNFLRCKRLYYYNNIKGIRVRPQHCSQAMLMGSMYDKLMGKWYGNEKSVPDTTYMTDISAAKVNAIMRVMHDIGLKPQLDGFIKSQSHFDYVSDTALIQGFYDRKYTNHFVEMKFTSAPRYYDTPFEIQNQVGTYFLADDDMEYCIMEITVAPQLKQLKKGKKRTVDESPDEYHDRVYDAILKQPSRYFIGLNRKTGTWGKKFYRKEFNLDAIKKRYECVTIEIQESIERGWFYQNTNACNMYNSKCDYYNICKSSGYVSESIYTRREKR